MANVVPYSAALARLAEEARSRGATMRHRAKGFASNLAKNERLQSVAKKEGTSLLTHAVVAVADNHFGDIPVPFIGGVAPSTITGALTLLGMFLTKGNKRVYARQMFQGVLHRKLSTLVDGNKGTISGVISGVVGTGDDDGSAANPDDGSGI